MEQTSSTSNQLPMQFERSSEILSLNTHGIPTFSDFRKSEESLQHVQWLKRSGLSDEEIELHQKNETGCVDQRQIEASVLRTKHKAIYQKISIQADLESISKDEQSNKSTNILEKFNNEPEQPCPEGHPINDIKQMDHKLFSHLKPQEQILPISKRRKILRRLDRKEKRLLAQDEPGPCIINKINIDKRPGSLWDLKEMPVKIKPAEKKDSPKDDKIIGPKKPTMYTIKDRKIVRLEPLTKDNKCTDNYQAVDIVMPVNAAEARLLEGTKMCIDDIKKIERFKDYEPGIPSKVLYLKNIASCMSEEQLKLLFKPFAQDNGDPIDVRLMGGRMRGQAFVAFQNEDVSMQALHKVNGTIIGGRPIIVQFGRNSNRIQGDR